MTTFYSQNGEDRWLIDNWARLNLPDRGVFVEIGVGDGVRISNTKMLEDCGWSGLLIEPDARHHDSIRRNRKATLVPAAIGVTQREFVLTDDPELSGFMRPGPGVIVPVRRLDDVFREHGIRTVDVISIDTEGTELEVWSTLDLSEVRPRVVLVEWMTSGLCDDNSGPLKERFAADGYECVATLGCNLAFVDRGAW